MSWKFYVHYYCFFQSPHKNELCYGLKSRALVIFGLNALSGRTMMPDGSSVGAWDTTNAKSFIQYTAKKNYKIYGWELGMYNLVLPSVWWFKKNILLKVCASYKFSGNELCGSGVGTRVTADQYSSDTTALQHMVQDIYKGKNPKIISPGGFFDQDWFKQFLDKTPKIDAITHHIYNLGAGILKTCQEIRANLEPMVLSAT